MNRTSPVQIVNKNGVQTTVHKRVDTQSSVTGRKIPIPSLSPNIEEDKYRIMVQMSFEMALNGSKMSDNVRTKLMDTLHPETLPRIEEILRSNTSLSVIRNAMSICVNNRNFAILNSMALLVPEMDDPNINNQNNILYALTGIQQDRDPKTPEVDLTNPADPRASGIRGYIDSLFKSDRELRMSRTTPKKGQRYINFVDSGLGKMLLEQPEHSDEILSLYRSHGTFDRDLFETALGTSSTSLIEGAL